AEPAARAASRGRRSPGGGRAAGPQTGGPGAHRKVEHAAGPRRSAHFLVASRVGADVDLQAAGRQYARRNPSGGRMSVDIRRETEELVRYYGELVRRLGQSGVRDVADLLALYERLDRQLETVGRQEIGWVTEQVQRLIEALVRMDADLDALRPLESTLPTAPEGGSLEPAARPRGS